MHILTINTQYTLHDKAGTSTSQLLIFYMQNLRAKVKFAKNILPLHS